MIKYLFLVVLVLGFQMKPLAQTPESIKLDSLRIDSLQKVLPSLRDTARINCLNSLAEAFLNRDGYKIKREADSAYSYAIMANNEAKKINFKHGIAYSLMHLNQIAFLNVIHNNNMSIDNNKEIDNSEWFRKWDDYMSQLFSVAQELNDTEILGYAYYYQADMYGKKKNQQGVIEAFKKSLFYFRKAGNEVVQAELNTWLCMLYSDRGEYENGFDYCKRSLELAKKIVDLPNHIDINDYYLQQALMNMSGLYSAAGDYETALDYLRESERFRLTHKSSEMWSVEGDMAELFKKMGQYDSVLLYEKPLNPNGPINMWKAKGLGETYLMNADYDSALLMFNKAINGFRKNKNANTKAIKNSLIGAAKAYLGKKNYKKAFPLVRESLSIAQNEGDRISVRDNFEILSDLFYHTGKNDSAYLYHKKYTALKDSILNRQFYWRLNNYRKEAEEQRKISQIDLLNKDNQLKEQKLKQEGQLKNFLLLGLLGLLLIGFFVFRWLSLKRKNERLSSEKVNAELHRKASELEMQALRAQMNPHFIFNCLSSINRFILKNETEAASDYLTRFSLLIRMVLINSQKSLITLEDELEMLKLYLDMERMRFKNSFDYHIIFTNTVDAGAISIPPLLLQPFCENAIWHGLMNKQGPGRLDISLSMEGNTLNCIIADNGIGRQKAAEIKSKSAEEKKSMGLKITTERLALLNQENNFSTFYRIEDILNENNEVAGTCVRLKIKYKESVEEMV